MAGTMQSIPGTGIKFRKGGLHETTGTPAGQPIPDSKMKAALAGRYGEKGKRQALLAQKLEGMRHGGLAKSAAGGSR